MFAVVFNAFWLLCKPDTPINNVPKPFAMVSSSVLLYLLLRVKSAAAKQVSCIIGVFIVISGLRRLPHAL